MLLVISWPQEKSSSFHHRVPSSLYLLVQVLYFGGCQTQFRTINAFLILSRQLKELIVVSSFEMIFPIDLWKLSKYIMIFTSELQSNQQHSSDFLQDKMCLGDGDNYIIKQWFQYTVLIKSRFGLQQGQNILNSLTIECQKDKKSNYPSPRPQVDKILC